MANADHDKRVLPLEGGHNFRDMGGYRTSDGRTVRWGQIYRSGVMSHLTPEDQDQLAALGIKLICDFRSNSERKHRPTKWREDAGVDLWARDHDSSVGDLIRGIGLAGRTGEDTKQMMIDTYRRLPFEQAVSYREVFKRIAAGDLPLVFHCSAGKDRTGVAAALLLATLGVSREDILEDYMLTERFFERISNMLLNDKTGQILATLEREVWEPFLRTDPAYLSATIETVEGEHGSIAAYMDDVLGVDEAMSAQIRARLLV